MSPNLNQILCFTEHHLTNAEMDSLFITQYNHGGKFCRTLHKSSGVCIFIQENILFSNIDFDKLSEDKDLEICAVKLHLSTINIVIISKYRSPTGDFHYFYTIWNLLTHYIVILLK